MALSSGARVPSLRHSSHPPARERDELPPSPSSAATTHRFYLRNLQTPVWNPISSSSCVRRRSSACSASAILCVVAGGRPDGFQNSELRRRVETASIPSLSSSFSSSKTASAGTSSLLSSRSRRRPGEAAATAALLLQHQHEFFVGSKQIGLRRAIHPLLPGHNNVSAGGQFDCRATINSEGATLDDVPHLSQWLPDLPRYSNPLQDNPAYRAVRQYFVESDDIVAKNVSVCGSTFSGVLPRVVVKLSSPSEGIYFRRAGPRETVCFKGEEVRAAIVTCGGLCPGLNTVIREIVCGLWTSYGVRDIIGINGGYAGFYSSNTIQLNPKVVNDIHKRGGTILGTSRGGHDKTKIVAAIIDRGINQVYIIGGDGTQKGANVVFQELKKLGVKVCVAGIPKTIDNDIAVIDKSFGFDTAVEEAQRAINAAHVEAESVRNGIGLVKLMGRYSGYIAMYATLASRDVDCCLIPEVPFYLEGTGGLFEFVRKCLRDNGHMVIVVAEGAGQELVAESSQLGQSDASGNRLLLDVGLWVSHQLKDHFIGKEAITLKYIDPTYMVRAIPSNASDNVYCTLLAHSAMHGAMAGYTGFVVGPVNGRHAYIPIATAVEVQNKVSVTDRMWARLLSSTQQPDFLQYQNVMADMKRTAPRSAKPVPVDGSNGAVTTPQETKVDGGIKEPSIATDQKL